MQLSIGSRMFLMFCLHGPKADNRVILFGRSFLASLREQTKAFSTTAPSVSFILRPTRSYTMRFIFLVQVAPRVRRCWEWLESLPNRWLLRGDRHPYAGTFNMRRRTPTNNQTQLSKHENHIDNSLLEAKISFSGTFNDGCSGSVRFYACHAAPTVTQIAAGGQHTLFVKSDSSLWAVGSHNYGQLGDGSANTAPGYTAIPKQILASGVTGSCGGKFP